MNRLNVRLARDAQRRCRKSPNLADTLMRRDMRPDSIRLDINDPLDRDLLAERILVRRSGNVLRYQQNRGCFMRAPITTV